MSILLVVLSIAALLIFMPAGVSAQQPDDVITTNTALVQLNVGVVDKQGRAVTSLSRNDFAIYEDGVRRPILSFDTRSRDSPACVDILFMPFWPPRVVVRNGNFSLNQIRRAYAHQSRSAKKGLPAADIPRTDMKVRWPASRSIVFSGAA